MTNEELFYLGNLIDPQKQASAFFLDYNLIIPALPKFEINWKYGLKEFEKTVEVCPKTLRPFYFINNDTWEKAAEEKFKMKLVDLFKGYKYFENFVYKYEHMPTYE